jgi:hypothetical protein
MTNLNISLENNKIHPSLMEQIIDSGMTEESKSFVDKVFPKEKDDKENPTVKITSYDPEYVTYLIDKKNDLPGAKEVLRNLKSVVRIINDKIMEVEEYLISCEGVK